MKKKSPKLSVQLLVALAMIVALCFVLEKLAYVEWLPYLEQYKKAKHGEKELLLITGSLYFLVEVRKYLMSDR